MKVCPKCGNEVENLAVICVHCGSALSNSNTAVGSADAQKKVSVSLILGIVGIVFAWLFALVGHITSIIGIVLGIKEYKETGKMTGLVVSIVGEVCSILSSVIGVVLTMSSLMYM